MYSYLLAKRAELRLFDKDDARNFILISETRNYCLFAFVDSPSIHQWMDSLGYHRIFERYRIFSGGSEEERYEAVRFLFCNIGGTEYLASIDRSRNISCYEGLYRQATIFRGFDVDRVLDLGSGPGLIMETAIARGAKEIICYDIAESNLQAMRQRGIFSINQNEFFNIKSSSIDVIISAFVLHYESITRNELGKALDILTLNGVWASNFHKSKGMERFLTYINKFSNIETMRVESAFGPIILAKKIICN